MAAGGVAANQAIRGALQDVAAKAETTLIIPPPALCTDNGAMIAWAGAERLALGLTDTMDAAPAGTLAARRQCDRAFRHDEDPRGVLTSFPGLSRWTSNLTARTTLTSPRTCGARARTWAVAMGAFNSVAVIGAGAWGTALAAVAARAGREVTLYAPRSCGRGRDRGEPDQSEIARGQPRRRDRRH